MTGHRTQSLPLTPKFLYRSSSFVQIARAAEIWILLISRLFSSDSQSVVSAQPLNSTSLLHPNPNPKVMSPYLETITMKRVGNGMSQPHSPLALFAEFNVCFIRKTTIGDLESHFLINNFCFEDRANGVPF